MLRRPARAHKRGAVPKARADGALHAFEPAGSEHAAPDATPLPVPSSSMSARSAPACGHVRLPRRCSPSAASSTNARTSPASTSARRAASSSAYVGYDCTGPSLHVGNLMSIMMLHWLQETGGKPIVLMGGGTTRVGDPSGKDETRQILTRRADRGQQGQPEGRPSRGCSASARARPTP